MGRRRHRQRHRPGAEERQHQTGRGDGHSPEGISASARTTIALDDPANPRIAGVAAWDSAEAGGEGATSGYVSAAVDGDTGSYWHTQWSGSNPAQPHYIVIDLGSEQKLTSFTHVPRAKSSCGSSISPTACNGQIAGYEILAATGGTWVAPTAAQLRGTTYPEPADATYTSVATGAWATTDTTAKTVTFSAPVTTRYLKLRSTSAVAGQNWSQAAELRVGGVAAPDPGTLPDVALTPTLTATPEKVSSGGSVTVVAGPRRTSRSKRRSRAIRWPTGWFHHMPSDRERSPTRLRSLSCNA